MHITKILFVINRNSGTADNTELPDLISGNSALSADDYRLYYLSESNDANEISELINSFKPRTICAAGGDGTVSLVASLIMHKPLSLGIIPIGSANGLAVELGIPVNPAEALELVLEGSPSPMDVVQINSEKISLHLSDAGFNARIVSEFEKEGKRGFSGYVKQFFREIIRPPKSFKCEIKINDRVHSHRSFMTVIANASKYRTGANINPTGKIDDGFFEIVVFKPYHRWKLRTLLAAFTGTMHKQPHVEVFQCKVAEISIKPPQELQVDGESLGPASHLKAEIQKHALNIIRPTL